MAISVATPTADARVRMILYDYDAAPDGAGTYTKLSKEFSSKQAAYEYRARYMSSMYWGRLEKLDGTFIESIEERDDDNHDWD